MDYDYEDDGYLPYTEDDHNEHNALIEQYADDDDDYTNFCIEYEEDYDEIVTYLSTCTDDEVGVEYYCYETGYEDDYKYDF